MSSPLATSIERTSIFVSPCACAVQLLPSSVDLKTPAVCVPTYAVAGCLGSNRTTHALSTAGMTDVQLAPESVLRRTPRPSVAASRVEGCAGETVIDQTGRSALPGCCAPVGVQRVSAADAGAMVASNPAASMNGVSRTKWRNFKGVPEKRSKDSRLPAEMAPTLHAASSQ